MKKLISLIMITSLILSAMLIFASCVKESPSDEPDSFVLTEENFWQAIEEKELAQKAYELTMNMKAVMYVSGTKVEIDSDSHVIFDERNENDPYYYTKNIVKSVASAIALDETAVMIEAYNDGKYFTYNESSETKTALYSEETYADFLKYCNSESSDEEDPDVTSCVNKSFVENEDGTFTYKTSGYTKKTISIFEKLINLDELGLDVEISDLELEVTADADANLKNGKFVFAFEEKGSQTPSISMEFNYKSEDEITRVTDDIDPSKYTKSENLLFIREIETMLDEKFSADKGSFTYTSVQSARVGTSTNKSTEVDTVKFSTKDGKYTYTIDVDYDGEVFTVTYENGSQSVISGKDVSSEPQTEEEAKQLIKSYASGIYYYPDRISEVKKTSDDGVYELTVSNPEKSDFESFYAGMGGKLTECKQVITVTVKDGKLIEIKSSFVTSGAVTSNTPSPYMITYLIDMTLNFEEATTPVA